MWWEQNGKEDSGLYKIGKYCQVTVKCTGNQDNKNG